MLVISDLQPVALDVIQGDDKELHRYLFVKNIEALKGDEYIDKRIVIKGCGDLAIGEFAYTAITKKLMPVAKSIMYGEACSTVPVFKKPAAQKEI